MTPEDYRVVREVFLAVRELPPDAQARHLAGVDAAIAAEVESLLAWRQRLSGFLGGDEPAVPERVGHYRIVSTLGQGGMGVVYLAEQENPRRQVAIKLVQPGAASPRGLERFRHEAQMLGRLHHPGIAQIFEAGSIDSGRGPQPFFAMELVRGRPLDAHANSSNAGLRARIELLAMVCDAVHHAHQQGVIHCDLKPANIVVDESGQPKVLDFGVARATDSDLRVTTVEPTFAALAGTLPYMSPEQTLGDPACVDTRSDVYALGVVGYELLGGRLPLPLQDLDLLAAVETIRGREPVRLGEVDRRLRGDAETIVHKALAKERDRRYASAAELAADLRRFLAGDPITARPASTIYHLKKFATRHRGLVGGVAVAFLALVLGVIATTLEWRRAQRQERLAARSTRFLEKTIVSFDPRRVGSAVRLTDVLERAAADLKDEFADAPEVEAGLRLSMAHALSNLGRPRAAEGVLLPAIAQQTTTAGAGDRRALEFELLRVTLTAELGRAQEAMQAARTLVQTCTATLGAQDTMTLIARATLAGALSAYGDVTEARAEAIAAVDGLTRTLGATHEETRLAHTTLVETLVAAGDLEAADAAALRLVASLRAVVGPTHPDVLAAERAAADCARRRGRLADAETSLRGILACSEASVGADAPVTLSVRSDLGLVLEEQGRLEEAEREHGDVLARRRKVLGPGHRHTLLSQASLAGVLAARYEHARATETLEEAIAEGESSLGPLHTIVLTAKNSLASVRSDSGDLAGGLELFREVLAARESALGRDHPDTMAVAVNCANTLLKLGQTEAADAALADVLPRQERVLGVGHRAVIEARVLRSSLYQNTGRLPEAEALLRELAPLALQHLGDAHPTTFAVLNNLADHLFWLERRPADALPWFDSALAVGARVFAPDHPHVLSAAMARARVLGTLGRADEAVAAGTQVLAYWQARAATDSIDVMGSRDHLARIYYVAQRWDDAAGQLAVLVDWLIRRLPEEPLRVAAAVRMDAECAARLGDPAKAATRLRAGRDALAAACGAEHEATQAIVASLQALEARDATADKGVRR